MTAGMGNFTWRVAGSSVRGASHIRSGLPNQDALGWLQLTGSRRSLIVAASDGHGSAKYFRSHIGSHLAVETALILCQEFLNGQPDLGNLSAVKRTAEERLPQEMTRRWRDAVSMHVERNPISVEELDALEKQDGKHAREAIASTPTHAYGATILTVVIDRSFIIYLQLGDGDILLVSESGEVERPLPGDERLFANETTSLSSQNAWSDFRFGFHTLVGPPPALILMSTDGYANSFISEEAFLKVGADILELVRSDGLETVSRNAEAWLNEASEAGSGDDTTLAVICRLDTVRQPGDSPPAQLEAGAEDPVVAGEPAETPSSADAASSGDRQMPAPESEKQ